MIGVVLRIWPTDTVKIDTVGIDSVAEALIHHNQNAAVPASTLQRRLTN